MSYINKTVPPPTPEQRMMTLRMIQMSFPLGILLFGGTILLLKRLGSVPQMPDTPLTPFMPYALGALLAGTITWRFATAKVVSEEQRQTNNLIGWAIGEAAAILGSIHWMQTGEPRWYIVGLFVLLGALVLHPIRRE